MDWSTLYNEGKNLEIFTASYFQSMDYYVDSNLKWLEDQADGTGKVDLFELDIYGKLFQKNNVTVALAECKRGCDFNDLFKFIGISKKVNPNMAILVCESHQEKDLVKIGADMGIEVTTPPKLTNTILSNGMEQPFLFFYMFNDISNRLFDKERIHKILDPARKMSALENKAYNMIRKHLSVLIGEIWKTPDLAKRSKQIKTLIDEHKDFVRIIARTLELKPGNKASEYYMRYHPLCQAAGYLMLKDRLAYIICAVECAIRSSNGNPVDLSEEEDPSFFGMVHEISRNIKLAVFIPLFLQGFLSVFGGVLSSLDDDAAHIAAYLNISKTEIKQIMEWLTYLFQRSDSGIQWGFTTDMGVIGLKYVPYPIKGLGIQNRMKLGYSCEGFSFKEEWLNSICNYQ